MPATVSQAFAIDTDVGVSAETSTATLSYHVRGTDDIAEANTALLTDVPPTFTVGGYVLNLLGLRCEARGPAFFSATARYGIARVTSGGSVGGTPGTTFNFELSGGTQRITQAKDNGTDYAPTGVTPPSFNGAIAVTDDGVEGVDILAPEASFSIVKPFANNTLDADYQAVLYNLYGKTNDAPFQGYAAGEVIFKGCSFSRRDTLATNRTDVTFFFAVQPAVEDQTIGDITGIDKPAWHVLWVRYSETEDTAAETVVKKPTSVHVNRVYDPGDFSELGI